MRPAPADQNAFQDTDIGTWMAMTSQDVSQQASAADSWAAWLDANAPSWRGSKLGACAKEPEDGEIRFRM